MHYHWNWGILFALSPDGNTPYIDLLLSGLEWTVITGVCAWVLAFILGSIIGVLRTLPSRTAERLGFVYVEFFRGIPLIVQLFVWFFVLPDLLPVEWGSWIKQLRNGPFYTSVIGLAFFTSPRVAEQVRAGIQSLAGGQLRAALAMGLTRPQAYRYVLLPLAYRIILPTLTSEMLNCLKNTSVALTIGLLELTAQTRAMQEFSFQVFEAFSVSTLLYVLLNLVVVAGMRVVERAAAIPGTLAKAR